MRIGLTGGVASGKSTVSGVFRELGALVIDADQLAREVVAGGTEGLAAVVAEFGPGVLTDEGELDRAGVASLVFSDESARARLEAIVHPLVFDQIQQLEAAAAPGTVVVHDIPLLAESERAGEFDAVVVVDAPEDEQLERMVRDRGWTTKDAESRMRAQSSRADRCALATHLIDNSGSLEDLRRRVVEIYRELSAGADTSQ